jgi:general secretion pathway protein J
MSTLRIRCRAFTLIEVLLALAILAVIAVLGYRAVSALSESETRLSAEANRWQTLDRFFARLEGDFRQAVPRPARFGETRAAAWVGSQDASGNSALEFSRAGPEFTLEAGSAGQRIAYDFRGGAVEVIYWASYDRPRNAASAAYPLVTDIAQFHLSYLTRSGQWSDVWPLTAEADLPSAVRVQLTLASGETIERWMALR